MRFPTLSDAERFAEGLISRALMVLDLSPIRRQVEDRRGDTDPRERVQLERASVQLNKAEQAASEHDSLLRTLWNSVAAMLWQRDQETDQATEDLRNSRTEASDSRRDRERLVLDYSQAAARAGLTPDTENPSRENLDQSVNAAAGYDPRDWEQRKADRRNGRKLLVKVVDGLGALFTVAFAFLPGIFLGVTLGKITGFVNLKDWEEFSLNPLAFAALSFGVFCVVGTGKALEIVTTLRVRKQAEQDQNDRGQRQYQSRYEWRPQGQRRQGARSGMASLDLAQMVLYAVWLAEIFAEGYGLRLLAQENDLVSSMLGTKGDQIPIVAFYLLGLLISSPYFVLKTLSATKKAQEELKDEKVATEYTTDQKLGKKAREAILKTPDFQAALARLPEIVVQTARLTQAEARVAAQETRLVQLSQPVTAPEERLREIDEARAWSEYHVAYANSLLAGEQAPPEPNFETQERTAPRWWQRLFARR